MFQRLFTVKYITSKNCFCSLSFNNLKLLQGTSILLNYNDDQSAFFTIDMGVSLSSDQHIGISSLYAKILGIAENSVVSASVIPKPTAIKTVTVCAISNDDHSVLELLAENIQSTLLSQIRLLYHDQKFVIWVGNVIYVTVRVCSVKPISPGLLENLTEVVIKSEPHSDELKKFSSKKDLVKFDTIFSVHSRELVLRLVPCSQLDEIQDFVNPFNVFISRFNLTLNLNTKSQPFICSMRSLSEPGEAVFVRVYILEDIIEGMTFKMLCMENVFVSATILDYFSCKMGTRVVLEPVLGPPPPIEEIEVYTKTKSSEDTFRQFLGAACKTQAFVLSPDVPFSVAGLKCFVKLLPCESRFCLVGEDSVKDLRLSVYNVEMAEEKKAEGRDDDCEEFLSEVSNYQDIVDNCLFLLGYNTKPYLHMYNILITGKAGTGKSTLLKNIEKTITAFPHFIYTVQVNCKKIKGKSVESLHKTFVNILFDLVLHQPSVLILDDLHVLCERVVENDILNQNSVYFNRVSEMLEGLLQTFCEYNSVGVLASSHSISKLNKHVYSTRGNHLFKNLYQITELSKADREKLLQFYFSHNKLDGVDLERLAEKTESFVVRDLVDFANKATFESFQEYQNQSVITIKPKHCEVALLTTVVTSLEGVKLLPAGTKDLNDVGGLEGAKKVLLETLRWPSKFPGVFSNSPLRVPTGLLLYGPPGTGKTLLAGAAARHCGLNLISIKGPELLSKYIGASEQAVRDLFQKAQSARPCILFFDEFDSLAPRRGHDNTGVTDRVVNQLLTQLDGIETLSGVFVLAATSRPDLLDPALLRPGRLDRHIRCSLPDKMGRFEILKVLSRNMKLAPDVKLRPVAEAARGHSGADLQAVLYSAQLESVKYLLEDEFQEDATDPQTEITQDQLMHAVKNTRPSLKSSELSKYERIYNRFEGKIPDDFAPGTRATLA